ncbi:uncharacterized protein MKK02DRAFT_45476 [Dioszegia hungarica]|uniref:Large ribosomal subunit protein mL59 domain-containing protein n=1 Tax=Dioszegia hungarica TaxID=4972 RepID=A0AA38HA79_9TREE|nr:uncharacterized protein MKK02DRAFT_45476 [Dioszegia hungarica]KAI9636768.1 hypothetical protein MKK02DRAFT_45476 [Dioszegia hungarica]
MNTLRQAVAGPSRRFHSLTLSDPIATTSQLPPVIERYIQRQRISDPSASSLPNPFSIHRSVASGAVQPRSISRRREKQLRFWFAPESLPPAPSATSTPFSHTLSDGTEASLAWQADQQIKAKKTLYEGRKVQFKGHKHERDRPERQRETEERLAGMEKRIAEWKRNKAEAKQSTKPALPF